MLDGLGAEQAEKVLVVAQGKTAGELGGVVTAVGESDRLAPAVGKVAEGFGHQHLVDLVETGAHPPDRRVAQPVRGFQRNETAVPVVLDLPVVAAGGAAGGEGL